MHPLLLSCLRCFWRLFPSLPRHICPSGRYGPLHQLLAKKIAHPSFCVAVLEKQLQPALAGNRVQVTSVFAARRAHISGRAQQDHQGSRPPAASLQPEVYPQIEFREETGSVMNSHDYEIGARQGRNPVSEDSLLPQSADLPLRATQRCSTDHLPQNFAHSACPQPRHRILVNRCDLEHIFRARQGMHCSSLCGGSS